MRFANYLLLLMFVVVLVIGCFGCTNSPNKLAKVKLFTKDKSIDTISIEYYSSLWLQNGNLVDDTGETKAYDVKYFSIIESIKTIK